MTMPGLIVLTLRAALAPTHGLGHHAQRVASLRELIGVEGVLDLTRREHRKRQQVVRGRLRQRGVLSGGQRAQAVAGLRGDDDCGPSARDDLAELFQHQRGPVEIDLEDRRRRGLRGRNSSGVDDARDIADRRGGFHQRANRITRRDVDRRRPDIEAGIAQHLGRGIGVLPAQIGHENALARAHPSRMACPIEPAPITTMTLFMKVSLQGQPPRRPSEEWGTAESATGHWRGRQDAFRPPNRR